MMFVRSVRFNVSGRPSICTRPLLGGLAALLLASACGGSDVTYFDAPEPSANLPGLEGAGDERGVRAALEVEDGDLVVTLRNGSNYDGRVALTANVDSPDAHGSSELGTFHVPAGETVRKSFPRSTIEGFEVAGSDWLRADVRYGYELDNGARGLKQTSLAARGGEWLSADEAIELGLQTPDVVLEGGHDEVEKAVGDPFRACIRLSMSFEAPPGGGTFIDEGLAPNLSPNSVTVPAQYYFYLARHAPSNTTVGDYLDGSGCTKSIPRKTSANEVWSFDIYALSLFGGDGVTVLDSAGSIPIQTTTTTISAGTVLNFSPPPIQYSTSTEQGRLSTSAFLALNSIRRLGTIGVTPQGTQTLRVSPNASDPTRSFYCRAVSTNCPTATTIRIGTDDATERQTIAHETGHFLHRTYVTNTMAIDTTYSQTNNNTFDTGNFSDQAGSEVTCQNRRTSAANSHSALSIEWQAIAHVEGIADFFQAVTYNKTTQSDCTIYQNLSSFNCEAEGRSFRICEEWFDPNLFGMVGSELDWTKMYWDFITDSAGNFHNLLLAEQAVSTWPAQPPTVAGEGAHWHLIHAKTSGTLRTQFQNATAGNVLDGAAH